MAKRTQRMAPTATRVLTVPPTRPAALTQQQIIPGQNNDQLRLLDLMDGYTRYLKGEKRSKQGVKRYRWGLTRAFIWLEEGLGRPATNADLTFDEVQNYKEFLGSEDYANSTIINALASLSDFSKYAIIKRLRWDNPTAGIKRPSKRRPDPNPLYEEDLEMLMALLAPRERPGSRGAYFERRNRVIVMFFLYTGLRLSEAANTRREDIKLRSGVVEVRHGKNDRDRTVDLHPHLIELLEPLMSDPRGAKSGGVFINTRGEPLSDKGLANIFSHWLPKRLEEMDANQGLHVYAHRLRHSFASMLVWRNESLRVIQELLGHAQLGTTEHYTKVARKQKRRAVQGLPRLDGPISFDD